MSTIKETVQSMIDCNACMVFYYTHSRPELKRIVHPILIVNKQVVCVESLSGSRKRFKLDGIKFSSLSEELSSDSVEGIIKEHISKGSLFTFRYSDTQPRGRINDIYTVEPSIIKEDMLITKELYNGSNAFFLKHIHPCKIESPLGSGNEVRRTECEGCINELANQQGHLDGCLKEPEIVVKRHFPDCGFLWNYETDRCDCGEIGWTRCWFNDSHVEVLPNM